MSWGNKEEDIIEIQGKGADCVAVLMKMYQEKAAEYQGFPC